MDSLIHKVNNYNISNLPIELIESILDEMPLDKLLDCNNCPIIENYVAKKYLSLNYIFKHMKSLIRHKNYREKVWNLNIKNAAVITDYYMNIINSNGGLVKHKTYNGEPIDLYILKFKYDTRCLEFISKFVDNDVQSQCKCFGYSGWERTVYLRQELINKIEYSFRSCAYLPPLTSIEIIKIHYPNGYDKTINGIDYSSPNTQTTIKKFL